MTSWHRFDLLESSSAVALMSDITPAWREVYSTILDELVSRHTTWWAASDWMTQFGDDPKRENYPERYRALIPKAHWGKYNVPGWTANGIEPYGKQMDPIAADGNLFFKGFLNLLLSLHRYVSGDDKWDKPFTLISEPEHAFTWSHSSIAEYLAKQWRDNPMGCHCENTKIWPY